MKMFLLAAMTATASVISPEITFGNLLTVGSILLTAGGLVWQVRDLKSTTVKHAAEIDLLNRKMERVLTLIEERTRPKKEIE